jgi:hypothetical protein
MKRLEGLNGFEEWMRSIRNWMRSITGDSATN